MFERVAHQKLADVGVRIFMIRMSGHSYPRDEKLWLHPNKTTPQWRADLTDFLERSERTTDPEDSSEDAIFNALYKHLQDLGYIEVEDVVSDVYEGRITHEHARIVPDPDHEEDVTGFGHFGWDARALDPKLPEKRILSLAAVELFLSTRYDSGWRESQAAIHHYEKAKRALIAGEEVWLNDRGNLEIRKGQ